MSNTCCYRFILKYRICLFILIIICSSLINYNVTLFWMFKETPRLTVSSLDLIGVSNFTFFREPCHPTWALHNDREASLRQDKAHQGKRQGREADDQGPFLGERTQLRGRKHKDNVRYKSQKALQIRERNRIPSSSEDRVKGQQNKCMMVFKNGKAYLTENDDNTQEYKGFQHQGTTDRPMRSGPQSK